MEKLFSWENILIEFYQNDKLLFPANKYKSFFPFTTLNSPTGNDKNKLMQFLSTFCHYLCFPGPGSVGLFLFLALSFTLSLSHSFSSLLMNEDIFNYLTVTIFCFHTPSIKLKVSSLLL